jgi:anti-sigma regulatory factor (Ser/Thr protein kinase)
MTADHNGAVDARSWLDGPAGLPRGLSITLPAAPQAARLARQATRQALIVWRLTYLADTAILLVSELVTNAVRHARTQSSEMWFRLETDGDWLCIEVEDADPRHPQPRTLTGPEESGLGFVLVDSLADKWGVYETEIGKTVWAELALH